MITGKELHDLFRAAANSDGDWSTLNTYSKYVYEEVASVLNGSHIAPLQGLVRDQQSLLAEMHLSWWDVPPSKAQQLEQRKDALLERAKQLIGEEPKS